MILCMNTSGERIQQALADAGLEKVTEAARAIGTNYQNIQSWIANKSKPKGRNLESLCRITGRSSDYFLRGVQEPTTDETNAEALTEAVELVESYAAALKKPLPAKAKAIAIIFAYDEIKSGTTPSCTTLQNVLSLTLKK